MLGKLIKHEFKSTWKIIVIANVSLLIMTILGILSFASKLWRTDSVVLRMLGVSSLMLYCISIGVISMVVCIYLIIHFYKTLYTDEGYLMHTLPVTPRQLILSKLLTGFLYTFVTFVNIFVGILLLVFSFIVNFSSIPLSEIISEFNSEFFTVFTAELGMTFPIFILYIVISLIVGSFSGLLIGYCSASLGQLYSKHKVLGSVLAYMGIYTVVQIVSSIATFPLAFQPLLPTFDPAKFFPGIMVLTIALCIISSIVMYIITEYIMKKKLNLD